MPCLFVFNSAGVAETLRNKHISACPLILIEIAPPVGIKSESTHSSLVWTLPLSRSPGDDPHRAAGLQEFGFSPREDFGSLGTHF